MDDFSGHRVGEARHKDYKIGVDMEQNELRPMNVPKGIGLVESVSTDAERATAGYKKTGDLITLPYEEVTFQSNSYASRVERVSGALVSNYVGRIDLDPFGDEWFETEMAPDLIVNVEGNFDTFYETNKDAIGTVWNSWETTWAGVVYNPILHTYTGDDQGQAGIYRAFTQVITENQDRTGIQTNVVAQVDQESQGTKVIQTAFIPYCRARDIKFTGTGFHPNIRLYLFFDKQDVAEYVTPSTGYSSDATIVAGSPLITSAAGKIEGTFQLPDPKIVGNPKFRTGEVEFRLTSSSTDYRHRDPATAATTVYNATGILETEQETIIATRNAKLVQTEVSESTSISTEKEVWPRGNHQPAEDSWSPEAGYDASGGRSFADWAYDEAGNYCGGDSNPGYDAATEAEAESIGDGW